MGKRLQKWTRNALLGALLGSSLLQTMDPSTPSNHAVRLYELDVSASFPSVFEESSAMVNKAVEVLSKGLNGLNEAEWEAFQRFYDPGHTGEIDQEFVESVVHNYQRIGRGLDGRPSLIYEPNSRFCQGMRLYYTDFSNIHVCPYVLIDTRDSRLARDLMHEVAHMTLFVLDRAYYYPNFTPYESLTPRGYWTARLPLVGHLFRELARADTLYHPDAYSHFAAALMTIDEQKEGSVSEPDVSFDSARVEEIDPSDRKFLVGPLWNGEFGTDWRAQDLAADRKLLTY